MNETEGFLGRVISKSAIAWRAAVCETDGAILDKDTFFLTVEHHKQSMKKKDEWYNILVREWMTTSIILFIYLA